MSRKGTEPSSTAPTDYYQTSSFLEMLQAKFLAAEKGDPKSQVDIGQYYLYGQGLAKNHDQALTWFSRAADQDYREGQFMKGLMYYCGFGVAQRDLEQATFWIRKAAEQGHTAAEGQLGAFYALGEGVPKDIDMAIEWLTKAAEKGDAFAQWKLGGVYVRERGSNSEEDFELGIAWYRKEAAQKLSYSTPM
ncbi:hypothetical protein DFQ26_003599 [Actinomortierella ambigua]|nr:hypothetical protein DFQ26_003599 [Actinomortierella ambigua]